MKKEVVRKLTIDFESIANKQDTTEYWFARELQDLLGYSNWQNFKVVIDKSIVSCINAGQSDIDHFLEVSKQVEMPNGGVKEIDDIMLTRFACYLIAQNGDPRKEQIAFAQSYFATQTRKQEVLEQRINEIERVSARKKLAESEKELSKVLFEHGVDNHGFARIRSMGDQALFGGNNTNQMKVRLNIPKNRTLADFLPALTIKAKDFANEITNFNVQKDDLRGEIDITNEHIKNNEGVRRLLLDRNIRPEELPAEEDIQKLERRLNAEGKKILKDSRAFKDRDGNAELF